MLDSDGIISITLYLMKEVLAVSGMSVYFFNVPTHVDSFRFSGHMCPELIESPQISVRASKFINVTP